MGFRVLAPDLAFGDRGGSSSRGLGNSNGKSLLSSEFRAVGLGV